MSFKHYHRIGAALAALVLVGSLTATGATLAPVTRAATLHASSAAATSTPMPTATTTSTPKATATPKPKATATPKPKATAIRVTATLRITPTTANRGGLMAVSGSGFAAKEAVNIALSGTTGTAATARADARGVLPPTGITIP